MDAQQKLSQFMSSVQKSTEAEIERATQAAEAEAAECIRETQERCAAESAQQLTRAKAKITARYRKKMSQTGYQSKTAALAKRHALLMQIFAKLRARLLEFTQSEDYTQWMISLLKKHPPQENDVILLRERDLGIAEMLKEAVSVPCSFRADKTVKIGGLSILSADGHRCGNHTLDEAYAAQLRDFYRNHKIGGGEA